MKTHRYLVASAILVSVAGCASFLAYGVRTRDAEVKQTASVLQREAVTRMQLENRIRDLQASFERLDRENAAARNSQGELAAARDEALKQVQSLKQEVAQINKAIASTTRLQLPDNWHHRQIESNRQAYEDIRAMLQGLDEDTFPTVRTWYGDAWRTLSHPFLSNQFPTESQRDQFVKLLGDIMEAEQRRATVIGDQSTIPVANDNSRNVTGLCIGPRWEKLANDLRSLQYE